MSLLMDALKKAEQAKRQAETGPRPLDLELEPGEATARTEPTGRGSAESLPPDLQSKLDLLDDDFSGSRQRQVASADDERPAGAAAEHQRAAAKNVFTVKAAPTRAGFYWTLGVLTFLGVIGTGAYVWWQLQAPASSLAPPLASVPTPPARPIEPPAPVASAVPAPSPATTPVAAEKEPAVEVSHAPAPQSSSDAASSAAPAIRPLPRQPPNTQQRAAPRPSSATAPRTTSRERLTGEPPAAATQEASIPIKSGGPRLAVSPDIARAYGSYLSGDLATARLGYEQVLRRDPRQTDALHGLAAISLREGRPEAADAYYARAFEADPTDARALAGLVASRGQADPTLAESRLKTTLATQPGAHAAHFALGNLYSQQGRWGEAQQAYFRAVGGDAGNPDYLFNLAVSLDQLRQPKLALQYYQEALAATRPAGFDRTLVANRIKDLQQ